jgi:hypothetical protein
MKGDIAFHIEKGKADLRYVEWSIFEYAYDYTHLRRTFTPGAGPLPPTAPMPPYDLELGSKKLFLELQKLFKFHMAPP